MVDRLPASEVLVIADWPDLELRRHELPPRGSRLTVVGDPPEWLTQQYTVTRADSGDGGQRLWTINPVLERIISQRDVPGTTIDLGCGQGRDAVWLAANGYDVIAVDHLPDAVIRGQELQARYAPTAEIGWQVGEVADWQAHPTDLLYMAYGPTRILDLARVTAREVLVVGFSEAHYARTQKPNVADLVTPRMAEKWNAEYGEMQLSDRHVAFFHCVNFAPVR